MQRKRIVSLLLISAAALICAGSILLAARLSSAHKLSTLVIDKTRIAFYASLIDLFRNTILTWPFWLALLLTLGLQKLFPARPEQKLFSSGLAHDFVWFFYETVLQTLVVVTYVALLGKLYEKYFSFLTIRSIANWPGWLRFLIAMLLVDFLYWCQHLCNHKVRFLWRLHAVHHSQSELNFFTDFRYHVLEYLVRHTFLVIPLLVLQINPPTIVLIVIVFRWYTKFYHGNIRTNLGLLRYVLVTPQSHRVHHSIEAKHTDKNFGAIFSVWDFIFGTQWRDYSIYPATGIADAHFPHRSSGGPIRLLLSPIQQMTYPLKPEKIRFASSSVSFEPTSNQMPGTRQT